MNKLITVIIPVYNVEDYLPRCLDSVCASSYRNLEIICVDDGSKDRSLEILREYEKRDDRIFVIAKKNGGVSSARNAGLDQMHGDYVTFIDSDDFIHPKAIELLYRAQEATNADIVICNHQTVQEVDLPIEFPVLDSSTLSLSTATWIRVFKNYFYGAFCWGRLLSSKLIQRKRFPEDLKIGEDSVFFTSLWDRKPLPECCIVNSDLYYYYVRASSAAHNSDSNERIDVIFRFLNPQSAETEEGKNVNFVFAITRLLRHIKYYSGSRNSDKAAVKQIARIMRKQSFRILRSPWFSGSEKRYFLVKAWLPRLKNPMAWLRNRRPG